MPKEGWCNVTIKEECWKLAEKMGKDEHRSVPNFVEYLIINEEKRRKSR